VLAELRARESVRWPTPGGLGLRDEGAYLLSRGVTELAEARVADAIVTLRRAVQLSPCPTCALPDLARAYELSGQRDSAIAAYDRFLRTPWSDWQLTGREARGTTYHRLGSLYEARGDTARAIAAYEAFAALWRTADSALQPEVVDARRRSQALARRQ